VRIRRCGGPIPAQKTRAAHFVPATGRPRDEALLVIDKPSGLAVHGGSGVSFGVIEQFRAAGRS